MPIPFQGGCGCGAVRYELCELMPNNTLYPSPASTDDLVVA